MAKTTEKVLSDALELPPQARAFLAERLIESLDVEAGPPLSQAWREELKRRCKEVDDGVAEFGDADKVFARAFTTLQ